VNRPIIFRRTRGSRSLGESVSSTELLDNTRTCHPLLPCATLFTAKRTTITMAASACPPLHPRCFHCVGGAWPGRSRWVGIGKGTAQAKAKAAMSSVLRTSGNLWCEGSETSSQFAHGAARKASTRTAPPSGGQLQASLPLQRGSCCTL
jgi:hypothetical protein